MADSFVKNISALFLQGFEIGFKKTLERGKYMQKEIGVTKQVGKKLNFWQKLWKYRVLTLMCVPAMIFFFAFNYMPGIHRQNRGFYFLKRNLCTDDDVSSIFHFTGFSRISGI